ncbi:hypothetical protein ACF09Z_37840 [Streptomyces erythrochromogenes]|uniref:hypothetical protein n=1 Tax=Streptomyces erythrochromogenes TaxID=285574 RepID=UPI0036F8C6F7
MPVVKDPDQVPLTPVYTIVIHDDGKASVDGQAVHGIPGQDPRDAALADVQLRAAQRGHPVRVNAKEPDGAVWPLIVDYDGEVTPLAHPHPQPAPRAPEPAPVPQPAPAAPPSGRPAPTVEPGPEAGWEDQPPPEYQEMLEKAQAAVTVGGLAAAAVIAADLEDALEDAFGPAHPYTVNALAFRAYTAALHKDWTTALALHLQTAERRHQARAPRVETLRLTRNAHAFWRLLAQPTTQHPEAHDPAAAARWAPELLRVLTLTEAEPALIQTAQRLAARLPATA